MRRLFASSSLALLATLSSACSLSTAGTLTDASVDAPAPPPSDRPVASDVPAAPDVSPGACQWRAGEAVVHDAPNGDRSNRRILDVRSAEGGAWVLLSDDAGGARQPDTVLERLEASGRRRAAVTLSGFTPTRASLAVDEALGRRAVLEESSEPQLSQCGLVPLDAAGVASQRRAITLPGGGFSLSGCRGLLANRAGYTFVSEQVRALWGLSMVQLDATGQTPDQRAPTLYDGLPEVQYARFALPERAFAMLWKEPPSRGSTTPRLRVRRYDEAGAARAEAQTVQETALAMRDFVATEAGDGIVALWEETIDTLPQQYGIALRALDANGAPRGAVRILTELGFYQGGLSATFARGDVLATGVTGSGVIRPTVVPLAPDGRSRGPLVPIPVPQGGTLIGAVRVVTTPAGALVVYTTDPERHPNRLVAVPLTCER